MKLTVKAFFSRILSLLMLSVVFQTSNVSVANAEFNNLTPCKESPAFQKRLASSVKKLENRLKFYTPESKETSILKKQIESTKPRFERYGNSTLLSGKEGLPRIIR